MDKLQCPYCKEEIEEDEFSVHFEICEDQLAIKESENQKKLEELNLQYEEPLQEQEGFKLVPCEKCDAYCRPEDYEYHLLTHQNESVVINKDSQSLKPAYVITCEICGSLVIKFDLKNHMQMHQQQNDIVQIKNKKDNYLLQKIKKKGESLEEQIKQRKQQLEQNIQKGHEEIEQQLKERRQNLGLQIQNQIQNENIKIQNQSAEEEMSNSEKFLEHQQQIKQKYEFEEFEENKFYEEEKKFIQKNEEDVYQKFYNQDKFNSFQVFDQPKDIVNPFQLDNQQKEKKQKKKVKNDKQKEKNPLQKINNNQEKEKPQINQKQQQNQQQQNIPYNLRSKSRVHNKQKPQQPDFDNMSPEQIYDYFTEIDVNTKKGFSQEKLLSLQPFLYKGEPQDCQVCKMEMEGGEFAVYLECAHIYHENCITKWLDYRKHCPVCFKEVEL